MPRQQELTAMIDWSYDLLSVKEKILFQYLSVFTGGWTLNAAAVICSDKSIDDIDVLNLMTSLADKSLIKVVEEKGSERFSMLETIFLYSKEKFINEVSRPPVQRKHAEFFRDFTGSAESNLTSGSQREWMQLVEIETDNIRESIKWFLDYDPSFALKTVISMCLYWSIKGAFSEGLSMLNASLEKIESEYDYFQGRALLWKGFFLLHKGHLQ
jgi:non-specific serine/threonine protein kinase